MERQIPDVWNIFSLTSGPDYQNRQNMNQNHPNFANYHQHWTSKSQDLLHKWSDRSSPCDRPRTYDKFYHKVPGNFIDPTSKSLCSSEAEDHESLENNSSNRKKKRRKKGDRKYSRTITERDVRHLDRHLSMKKTIRKKIMRDLQQAFVQDNDQIDKLDLNQLNFDPKKKAINDANLLDLLKQEENQDSGHGTDPGPSPSQSVDRASGKNSVRKLIVPPVPPVKSVDFSKNSGDFMGPKHQHRYLISDSSSCGGYESAESSEKDIIVLAAEQIETVESKVIKSTSKSSKKGDSKKNKSKSANNAEKAPKKKSFWQKLTANLKGSSS